MAFKVINTSPPQKGFMHDTAKPFMLQEVYYRGYKSGMATMTIGRYATRAYALAAARRRGLGEEIKES